jgi:hypothetical protein
MRSPAAAIAWEFRRRHRWGLMVLASYLIVIAIIRFAIIGPGRHVTFENEESFAFFVIVPIAATFMYFLAVFSFGLSGDFSARQSIYPARMFALPMTTNELALWPMLYGAVAMAVLWFATRTFAAWPAGHRIPVLWPALLAASLLAWTQALTWMPYALPGLRVIVTVLWLAGIDAIVMIALEMKAGELVMIALLAPNLPLAYLVARRAIARARRGDVPQWRATSWPDLVPRRRRAFASAASAQVWFEWRAHGRTLPALVAILLPFELAMLFIFRETPYIIFETFFVVLFTPAFMAAFVAATAGTSNPIATRPMTDASLLAAKLKATMLSTAATWSLVLIALPGALKLSGTWRDIADGADHLFALIGPARGAALIALGICACIAATWKQLVQSLFITMSGRESWMKGSLFAALTFLAILWPSARWITRHRAVFVALWHSIPWIAAVLVTVKIVAGGWMAARLESIIGARKLVIGAALWCITVFALYGALAWILPNELLRRYVLMLFAILMVPLARVSATPLVLAWSRHR